MQEASLVMWRKLDQLREESEFLPWAKVIVRFESLKARRTFARNRHQFGDDILELLAADDNSSDRNQSVLGSHFEKLPDGRDRVGGGAGFAHGRSLMMGDPKTPLCNLWLS